MQFCIRPIPPASDDVQRYDIMKIFESDKRVDAKAMRGLCVGTARKMKNLNGQPQSAHKIFQYLFEMLGGIQFLRYRIQEKSEEPDEPDDLYGLVTQKTQLTREQVKPILLQLPTIAVEQLKKSEQQKPDVKADERPWVFKAFRSLGEKQKKHFEKKKEKHFEKKRRTISCSGEEGETLRDPRHWKVFV